MAGLLSGVKVGDVVVTAEHRYFAVRSVAGGRVYFGSGSADLSGDVTYGDAGVTTCRPATATEAALWRSRERDKQSQASIYGFALRLRG